MGTSPKNLSKQPASLIRRLAAMFYDSLLCIAIMIATTGFYMLVQSKISGSEEYAAQVESGATLNDPFLFPILLVTLFGFFGFFWTRTGQTLGMQVWHIQIQSGAKESITWTQSLIRFVTALVSLSTLCVGYLWVIFDPKKRSWQCIASNSEVIRIPKRK